MSIVIRSALALLLAAGCLLAAGPRQLTIGNGADWDFVNGLWSDSADRAITPPKGEADYYYAFYKGATFSDLEATFKLRLETNHCDAGFIVRAQDPANFYLIHFPNGGQQYRAQHFWAAISKMDGSGYLRLIKLALVRRTPSNLGIWHDVKLTVEGGLLTLWVDGYRAVEVHDTTFLHPGRVGLAGFTKFSLRDVVVKGTEQIGGRWDAGHALPRNFFIPVADKTYGAWQHAKSLVRGSHGDLLFLFETSRDQHDHTLLSRSSDNGRTWTVPELQDGLAGFTLFALRDGRLIALKAEQKQVWRSEWMDGGKTWEKPVRAKAGAFPEDPPNLSGTYMVQLKDGTLVQYLIGTHSSTPPGANVLTWGIVHCQAFSIRSTDGGLTWSAPVNLDGNPTWPEPGSLPGNLDLTEAVGVETSDGRILTLIRPIYSPWMWESWSGDGGKTWGPAMRGPFPGYAPQPMLKTSTGAILIATRFPGLTVHVSYDDGRNWDEGTYIDSSIWVMGNMIEVEPGLVLMVYMDSFEGPMRAQFIRVTPHGLEPAGPRPTPARASLTIRRGSTE